MAKSDELLKRMRDLHPSLIDLSLGRIKRLLDALGNPHEKLPPVIHIAGTNGKGSVAAFLTAIFEAAGLQAHSFTSPHLRRFNERIRLGSSSGTKQIDDDRLTAVLENTDRANNGAPITFFEITAAAAFLAFSRSTADILILETGLGGRLDATNVIDQPALSIITPVSVDHTSFLGEDLASIAFEKAGILKPDVTAIIAHQPPEVFAAIAEQARKAGAKLVAASRDWDAFEQHGRMIYQDTTGLLDLPLPVLVGRHQIGNAGTAIAAVRHLDGFDIAAEHLEDGLTGAHWPGRLQRLTGGALNRFTGKDTEIWLDGGHNPAAGAVLAQTMADLEERNPRPLHLVCAMMERKDAAAFLAAFKGLARFVATIDIPGNDNAWPADKLQTIAREQGLQAQSAASLKDALELSGNLTLEPERVLICGSLHLAGHVLTEHDRVLS